MKRQTLEEYVRERIKQKGKMPENEAKQSECDFNYCCCSDAEARIKSETKPGKTKQERMVTRTVSYTKGEEVVYYNILYGFGRQDVLEKLYHYEQEEEEANERSIRGNRESYC